jgi:four helix bundle protein
MKSEEKKSSASHKRICAPDHSALLQSFQNGNDGAGFGKQVLRSGTSVGANYREANRARFKAEFISKMGDCLKEADETLYWLELLVDEKIVSEKKMGALVSESSELVAIFITILKKARGHE